MGKRRNRGRNISGILLLDKPAGVTSNGALQMAKKMFAAAKAGHTGSLDPLATGMLPICFGEATKFSQFLLNADKRYQVRARLGVMTETGDADGEVVSRQEVAVSEAQVLEALAAFKGPIEQTPSMYSAIKHNGEPLYKLARRGITVEREPRAVTIHELALCALDGDELDIEVACSKGTYVRTLIEELGHQLGCGAHVTGLRRLNAGPYPAENMISLEELGEIKAKHGFAGTDEKLLPLYTAVADWPRVELGDNTAWYLSQGQAVMTPNRPRDGWVSLYEASSETFLGVGEVEEDGRVAPRRLVAAS